MPLSNGKIAVFGPTAGAKELAADSKIVSLAAQKNEIERLAQICRP